jgi:hypothetical protein
MFSDMIYMLSCAESAKFECQKSVNLLHEKMNKFSIEKNNFLQKKIQNFIQQVHTTKIEFSCQLFDFNWKFLFKFITTGFMYFVILIQFEAMIVEQK